MGRHRARQQKAIGDLPNESLYPTDSPAGIRPGNNLTYALRFLDGIGNILYTSNNQNFGAAINTSSYTKITFNAGVVPAGATAAFIEFSQAIGPIGTGPAGENWFAGRVLIDDLSLRVP